jgi:hypothetical protein
MFKLGKLIVALLIMMRNMYAETQSAAEEQLKRAVGITDHVLAAIYDRWDVSSYPSFLRSVAMHHSSWDILRLKFQIKIMQGLMDNSCQDFTMSFMGSSVTAGHDTNFSRSFSELTVEYMKIPLGSLNIIPRSRNLAMGSNPCIPYDLCVRTFAGEDSDLIHWEQSYNCATDLMAQAPIFEHFVRDAMSLETRPVVVFSDSSTPNWPKDDCISEQSQISDPLSASEQQMLDHFKYGNIKAIATEDNTIRNIGRWDALYKISEAYRHAGIQVWNHDHYLKYKCKGPYVPEWGCCSASWHPSVLGHELRAAHHAFFWLHVYRDAILALVQQLQSFDEGTLSESREKKLLELLQKHSHAEKKHAPIEPLFQSHFSPHLQCFTSFRPHTNEKYSLENLVISSQDARPGFSRVIYETGFQRPNRGPDPWYWNDRKYMLYGNTDNGSMSLKINVRAIGISLLCQPRWDWGALPRDFENLWSGSTELYLSPYPEKNEFAFRKTLAKQISFTQKFPEDEERATCVYIDDPFPVGTHVLTVVPTTKSKIAIGFLLIP